MPKVRQWDTINRRKKRKKVETELKTQRNRKEDVEAGEGEGEERKSEGRRDRRWERKEVGRSTPIRRAQFKDIGNLVI